jgi:hypothetical protein
MSIHTNLATRHFSAFFLQCKVSSKKCFSVIFYLNCYKYVRSKLSSLSLSSLFDKFRKFICKKLKFIERKTIVCKLKPQLQGVFEHTHCRLPPFSTLAVKGPFSLNVWPHNFS